VATLGCWLVQTPPQEADRDTKTLLLLRHAKASRDVDGVDHERPLTNRGRRDAEAVGALLQARGLMPDVVVCSTATRTRETWDRAVRGGVLASEVRYLEEIYQARMTELVRVVRGMPESASSVCVVGHAPGIPDLVEFLAARVVGSPDWARLDRKFPTAGLAVLSFAGTWAAAGQARAELISFDVPRGTVPTPTVLG